MPWDKIRGSITFFGVSASSAAIGAWSALLVEKVNKKRQKKRTNWTCFGEGVSVKKLKSVTSYFLVASSSQVEGHTVYIYVLASASHSGYFQFCVAVSFLQIINPPVLKQQFSEESQYPTSGLDTGKRSNYIKDFTWKLWRSWKWKNIPRNYWFFMLY